MTSAVHIKSGKCQKHETSIKHPECNIKVIQFTSAPVLHKVGSPDKYKIHDANFSSPALSITYLLQCLSFQAGGKSWNICSSSKWPMSWKDVSKVLHSAKAWRIWWLCRYNRHYLCWWVWACNTFSLWGGVHSCSCSCLWLTYYYTWYLCTSVPWHKNI